eukprot:2219064-Pleurochrysis_carterae.AAC.1
MYNVNFGLPFLQELTQFQHLQKSRKGRRDFATYKCSDMQHKNDWQEVCKHIVRGMAALQSQRKESASKENKAVALGRVWKQEGNQSTPLALT